MQPVYANRRRSIIDLSITLASVIERRYGAVGLRLLPGRAEYYRPYVERAKRWPN